MEYFYNFYNYIFYNMGAAAKCVKYIFSLKENTWGLPQRSSGLGLGASTEDCGLCFLVKDLRSCRLCGIAKKEKKTCM